MRRALLPCATALRCACSGSNANVGFSDGGSDGTVLGGGDSSTFGEGGRGDGGGVMVSTLYAHTDSELYTMDPSTHAVTDVGAFQDTSGTLSGAVTDLAVNANGDVYVNSESAVYKAAVPSSPGPVPLTLVTTIAGGSGQRFYALGFAPAGVLGSGEGLVAGDNNGELWFIDTSKSNAAPQDLGGFGAPWELSGDVVFYTQNGAPTGLATIRQCPGGTCDMSNDSLAAIDMNALAQAYSSRTPGNLLKGLYGSGTGFGDIYGLGAWNDKAYGFTRAASGSSAELISIDGTSGAGMSLQSFGNITKGWSGAGVTTKAVVNVPPPTK